MSKEMYIAAIEEMVDAARLNAKERW